MAERTRFNQPSLSEIIAAKQTTPINPSIGLEAFIASRKAAQEEAQSKALLALQAAKEKLAAQRMDQEQARQNEALALQRDTLAETKRKNKADEAINLGKISSSNKKAEDKMTPGQIQLDKEFAKEYNDYVALGGSQAVASNLQRLDSAISNLEGIQKQGAGVERGAAILLPDSVRGIVTPQYKSIEQDARTNVLALLRATLGPQFTEKEGERIFAQTFDPTLPPETNLSRLRSLRDSLRSQAAAKEQSIKAFEQSGSLQGTSGSVANISSAPATTRSFKIIKKQ